MNLSKILNNPSQYMLYLSGRFRKGKKSNISYLNDLYKRKFGKPIDWDNPCTYSEKLQWLKAYYRDDSYPHLVDKVSVKELVSSKIGSEYLIPTIGVWNDFDSIDFNSLPDSFVIKCTHDSGGIVICDSKTHFNINDARRILNRGLRRKYYLNTREWPYAHVQPRLLAEPFMSDFESNELKDYKFFCFNGEPKALFVATGRQAGDTRFNFYDLDFNLLPFTNGHENSDEPIEKPKDFELMIEIARKLSEGIPHVRVDLYQSRDGVKFGEMTFFHWSGLMPFDPPCWDITFGDWLALPEKNWDGSF